MSEKRARAGSIAFRVNKAERDSIQEYAALNRIPVGSLARMFVLAGIADTTISVDNRAKWARDCLTRLDEMALVIRKRTIHPEDAERLIVQLQRTQIFLLRSYRSEP
jgi:hypothetical protein